jgi:hypothetical protein
MNAQELNSALIVIFEKEENDLDVNIQKNRVNFVWQFIDGKIVYESSDTLISIFSNIQNNKKLVNFFINKLLKKIIEQEDIIDDFYSIGVSHLCFYTLIKLGKVKLCLLKLLERKSTSYLIPLIINDMLKENKQYFNSEQLDIIKEYLNRELINSDKYSDIILNNISIIINSKYELLKKTIKNVNLEINQDKESVKEKVNHLEFSDKYSELLDEIDNYIYADTSKFVNSAIIGNLRVFIEDILKDIANRISVKLNESIPKDKEKGEMGNIRAYLKTKLELHENDDKFINGFINILHHEGGHAFMSEKEYFRLARNIAIEFALFFLSKYEKTFSKRNNIIRKQ